ncbi:MAG: addiction module protein [Balneolales bacterium]
MITDLKEIENSALNLNKRDKARLADKLLQSIHGAKIDPDIEQAWIDEVQKRKESLKSGKASLHSSTDVLKEARKRIQK